MIVTVFAYLSRYFFNHCFAKADFLIAREHSNFVQLLCPYGRTSGVHESFASLGAEQCLCRQILQDQTVMDFVYLEEQVFLDLIQEFFHLHIPLKSAV